MTEHFLILDAKTQINRLKLSCQNAQLKNATNAPINTSGPPEPLLKTCPLLN